MATLKELGGSELVKDSRKDINDNFNALNIELGGKSATGHIHKLSDMTEDSAHRTVTDTDKSTWSGKADAHTHPYASDSHSHTKSDIGLDSVENKSSATIRGEITAANINAVATEAATGSTAVKRNSSGDITARYFFGSYMNINHSASARTSDTVFYSSKDDYIRKNTSTGFKTALALNAVENKSSATIRGEITAANINAVGTQSATGSTVVKRNSSGDIYCRYIRATAGFTTSTPTAFWVEISSDTLMRKMTVANVKSKLNIKSNAERACTISTASPSGGSNGDVWYKY